MSKSGRFGMRLPDPFLINTRDVIERLYELGLRDDTNMTAYTLEAIAEKRAADEARINKHLSENSNSRAD